jgi:hypothetical protein
LIRSNQRIFAPDFWKIEITSTVHHPNPRVNTCPIN